MKHYRWECSTFYWFSGFTGPPLVEQVNLTHVRVSWEGLVKYRKCADQFLVKYWQKSSPQVRNNNCFAYLVLHWDLIAGEQWAISPFTEKECGFKGGRGWLCLSLHYIFSFLLSRIMLWQTFWKIPQTTS